MKRWFLLLFCTALWCVSAFAEATTPRFGLETALEPPEMGTEEEIREALGVFTIDALSGVQSVEITKGSGLQRLDIAFEDGVWLGRAQGYAQNWLTAQGIFSELWDDIDGDGAQEYLVLYLVSGVQSSEDIAYWDEQWHLAIYEAGEQGNALAADILIDLNREQERFVNIIDSPSGRGILVGSVTEFDDSLSASLTVYGYDGENAYVQMLAYVATDARCYAAIGPFALDKEDELREACDISVIEGEEPTNVGLIEGENLWITGDASPEPLYLDLDNEIARINREAFSGITALQPMFKAQGVIVRIDYSLPHDATMETCALRVRGAKRTLLWANEAESVSDDGVESASVTMLLCSELDYEDNGEEFP
ncbi:MAG: hypothetical protein IJ234_03185 [Clostridia bacterium]|nr:hypothetical protein [Clostridia bacterium]